ncbi:hypothetical protein VYU27_000569 [Nannochloropsis oceanica]
MRQPEDMTEIGRAMREGLGGEVGGPVVHQRKAVVIKSIIRRVIVKQLEVVLAAGDGEDMCDNEEAAGGGGDRLMQLTLGQAVARRPASAGAALFGMESGSDDSDAEMDPSPFARAQAIMEEYGKWCKTEGLHKDWQQVRQLWACDADGKAEKKGAREFPALARVFRCLLGVAVLSKEELVEAIPPRLRRKEDFHKYHQLDPIYKTREDEEEDMDDF